MAGPVQIGAGIRLLGPVIHMKLGVTSTGCQVCDATVGELGQAGIVGRVFT